MVFSGEDGIRTHAPVKTNGFQDRPVMTTSVPLHIPHIHLCFIRLADDLVILSFVLCFVNTFFQTFLNFFMFFIFNTILQASKVAISLGFRPIFPFQLSNLFSEIPMQKD